jgi:chemotaxis signal transduction protein
MTLRGDKAAQRSALDLRREFDRSFSQEPQAEREASEELLLLRVASDRYALRGAEIRGILMTPKLTRVPSPLPELFGLAGIRGALVPVFDLGRLLGQMEQSTLARWLFLANNEEPVAFAFDVFERHVRVPKSAVSRAEARGLASDFAEDILQLSGKVVPIISIPLVLSAIERSSDRAARGRENV